MFLQDLSESGEVESLVVLEQNEAEVELAEGQLQVVQCAQSHVLLARDSLECDREARPHDRLSLLHLVRLRCLQVRLEARKLTVRFSELFYEREEMTNKEQMWSQIRSKCGVK